MLLLILLIAYWIVPFDLFHDAVPLLGWIDDTLLIGLLLYFIKFKRFPRFFSNKKKNSKTENFKNDNSRSTSDFEQQSPYYILGIRPHANQKEIKAAYRKAVQTFHPDKVSHLGPEFQELAKKKFIKIQEAYNMLAK